jgi:hypothetical protein
MLMTCDKNMFEARIGSAAGHRWPVLAADNTTELVGSATYFPLAMFEMIIMPRFHLNKTENRGPGEKLRGQTILGRES